MTLTALSDIYAAYIDQMYSRVERKKVLGQWTNETVHLEAAERQQLRQGLHGIAVRMLSTQNWQLPLEDVRSILAEVSSPTADPRLLLFVRCRIENPNDLSALFSFEHKTIAEYLAAEAFATSLEEFISLVDRSFAVETPEVLSFFRHHET